MAVESETWSTINFVNTVRKLERLPAEVILGNGEEFNHENRKAGLQNLVKCDAAEKPIVVGEDIEISSQKRGNCTAKSYNIALRFVASELDSSLVFNGKNGSGDLAYKKYKQLLVEKHLDNLFELSGSDHRAENYHQGVISALKNAFLKAAEKGNVDLMRRINDEVFVGEGIDPLQLKNLQGKSAIVLGWQQEKVLGYLRELNSKNSTPSPTPIKNNEAVQVVNLGVFNALR